MSLLQTAIAAAEAAAEAIRRARTQPLEVRSKGFRDVVTAADFAAERAIQEVIHAAYPGHAIMSEEDKTLDLTHWTPPAGALWIIDPLDGTTNFARGIPSYCTSVGVMVDGVLEAGAIIDPLRRTCFAVARGQGLTVDGVPAQVSTLDDLEAAIVACDWPRTPAARATVYTVAGRLLTCCRTLRAHGSAALNLAYVAAGWYDIYFHAQLSPWDMAAGVLMIREAGGQVSALEGEPLNMAGGSLLASNGKLHAAVLAQIQAALE